MARTVRMACVVFVLSLVPAGAFAQETGGSFGGGDFSSSGSSGSSGSSWGGGGSSGSDFGSSSGGGWSGTSSPGFDPISPGSSGGTIGCGGAFFFLIVLGVVVLLLIAKSKSKSGDLATRLGNQAGVVQGGMQVQSLSLALDWRARPELQSLLSRLASAGKTGTPQGRAELLREVAIALRRAELSWLYASYRDLGAHMPQNAEQAFRQAAAEARGRFRRELVRSADGTTTEQETPQMRARSEEGKGVVVVTLVTATRGPLSGVFNVHSGEEIRTALATRSAISAQDLVALEVIWSPAAENDRMSTAELEQIYTDMKLIDPKSIAGRVFCAYCNGPFAAELMKCPHCGAPRVPEATS